LAGRTRSALLEADFADGCPPLQDARDGAQGSVGASVGIQRHPRGTRPAEHVLDR